MAFAQACLEKNPDDPALWTILGTAKRDEGLIEEATVDLERAAKLAPGNIRIGQRLLFQSLLTPGRSPTAIRQEHEAWAERHARHLYPSEPLPIVPVDPNQRLRIGYVSPDWSRHAMGQLSECLLRHHDRKRFEVFCYYCSRHHDSRTQILAQVPEHWVEAGDMDDAMLEARIRRDRIQILIDLAGHTPGGRPLLFARRPAPIQVTFLGYPATTGITTIGYRFTDAIADPAGLSEDHCSETLVRLAPSGWCFTPAENTPPVNALPASRNTGVVFGCFNNFFKAGPFTLALWARTLEQVPDSRLLLKARLFQDRSVRRRLLGRFAQLGVNPERIELRSWVSDQALHLSAYHEVDVALDTFPYHGTTTTCEALHMGVPVVSLAGNAHVSRVGASLLHSVGLADFCLAGAPDDYVAKAAELCRDRARLAVLRSELRGRMENSPLMDGPGYTQSVERALTNLSVAEANGGRRSCAERLRS